MTRLAKGLRRLAPLLGVLVAFVWSALAILSYRAEEAPPDTLVIRIGHWQLEPGVREALNIMGREYEQLCLARGQKVRIVQDAIPEGTYGQWLTAQLMGGTAPDIIECGLGLPYPVLLGYYRRYFLPLTSHVNRPNPYNATTPAADQPWRATYKDAMRGSYIDELQDYMTVPLSQFGCRVFFNRDLLRRLTGLEQPPRAFRDFITACETIRSQKTADGKPYIPISCSAYHLPIWDGFMAEPLTYSLVRKADFNRDGAVDNSELLTAILSGRADFTLRPYAGRFAMIRALTRNFQPGFTGLGRDEAVFPFAQQRAVFIATGTWDQRALRTQAAGRFEIGLMDFPLPTPDDPEFGDLIEGPVYERPQGGFPFGITRTCRHPELALDFLRYLSSQKGNERLNQIIGWLPAISGATPPEDLKAFEPRLKGVYGASPFTLGGETMIKWSQEYANFQVGLTDFPTMMGNFGAFYRQRGPAEYDELLRNERRGQGVNELLIAVLRARALMPVAEASPEAVARDLRRYRLVVQNRLLNATGPRNHGLLRRLQAGDDRLFPRDPYRLSDPAMMNVRARLAAAAPAATSKTE